MSSGTIVRRASYFAGESATRLTISTNITNRMASESIMTHRQCAHCVHARLIASFPSGFDVG